MDNIRFGIVGLGNMGSHHTRYLNDVDGASMTALCDTNPDKLKTMTEKHGVPGYDTAEAMIDSGNVDAVLIATPHYDHCPIARYAFSKNIHVLVEKPVAVSVKDARLTNEAYKATTGLKFGIMFQQRTTPVYQKIKQLVREGELGEIGRISWIITNWFRTNSYYASGGWRATWDGEGGGVLINQCPHNLDLIWWLTGMMPSKVTAVCNVGKDHPIEVEDEASAILEYPNGAMGHFITTTGEAPGTNRLEICGEWGKFVCEHNKLQYIRNRESSKEVNEQSQASFANIERWSIDVPVSNKGDGGHRGITQNFVNAILKGEELLAPGVDGVHGLEIGNAIQMAGLTGSPVSLPVDGDAYDAFIEDMKKKYGGQKNLATSEGASADMESSFH